MTATDPFPFLPFPFFVYVLCCTVHGPYRRSVAVSSARGEVLFLSFLLVAGPAEKALSRNHPRLFLLSARELVIGERMVAITYAVPPFLSRGWAAAFKGNRLFFPFLHADKTTGSPKDPRPRPPPIAMTAMADIRAAKLWSFSFSRASLTAGSLVFFPQSWKYGREGWEGSPSFPFFFFFPRHSGKGKVYSFPPAPPLLSFTLSKARLPPQRCLRRCLLLLRGPREQKRPPSSFFPHHRGS